MTIAEGEPGPSQVGLETELNYASQCHASKSCREASSAREKKKLIVASRQPLEQAIPLLALPALELARPQLDDHFH